MKSERKALDAKWNFAERFMWCRRLLENAFTASLWVIMRFWEIFSPTAKIKMNCGTNENDAQRIYYHFVGLTLLAYRVHRKYRFTDTRMIAREMKKKSQTNGKCAHKMLHASHFDSVYLLSLQCLFMLCYCCRARCRPDFIFAHFESPLFSLRFFRAHSNGVRITMYNMKHE